MLRDIESQMEQWYDEECYAEIIELLESLPPGDLTPHQWLRLALCYERLGERKDCREQLCAALRILAHCCDIVGEDNAAWNYEVGRAYMALEREGEALPFFIRAERYAQRGTAGELDARSLVRQCLKELSFPEFSAGYFYERVKTVWQDFAKVEGALRDAIDCRGAAADITGRITEIFRSVGLKVSFETEQAGNPYHITFSVEGQQPRLFALLNFISQCPPNIARVWSFTVGSRAYSQAVIDCDGRKVPIGEIWVRLEELREDRFCIGLYHPVLAELKKRGRTEVWQIGQRLLNLVLGELVCMAWIEDFDIDDDVQTGAMPLSTVRSLLASQFAGDKKWDNASALIRQYTFYTLAHVQREVCPLRGDVVSGFTCCPALISDFIDDESGWVDEMHLQGIIPAFVAISLKKFCHDGRVDEVEAHLFCATLEKAVTGEVGTAKIDFIGRAVGTEHIYVDFIAYDLAEVITAFRHFFACCDKRSACFQVFRRRIPAHPLV